MEKSMFFNSVDRDRLYNADDLCLYLDSLFESGVLKRDNGSLDITAGDGMQVIVSSGYAFINGHLYVNDDDKIISVDNADGVYNRIDSIVVRLDSSLRQITVELKKGQNASSAAIPSVTRDGDIYELQLGYVTINKGIVSIEQSMITDTRDDTAVCGYVINNAEEGERLQRQIDQIKTDDPVFTSYLSNVVKFWRNKEKNEKAFLDYADIFCENKTLNDVINEDLVNVKCNMIDLADGIILQTFFKTANDFVCYRKPAGISISNGIPNSDSSYCFYIKIRTSVIGYRYNDKTTWFSNFVNDELSGFKTFISPDQITDSIEVSEKGKKVADAYALKVLNEELKGFVKKNYSGSAELSNLANLEQWARTVDNYAFYRKEASVKVQGGIPDSDASVCFYVRMGTFVFGHKVSDKTLWYAPFYNDKLSDFAELTNVESVKYKDGVIKDIPSGSFMGNFLPSADNYRIYRKDSSTAITGGLPNSSGKYEFYIKLGSIVLGYSTNGHFYLGACLNNTIGGWVELPDINGALSGLSLDRDGSGQLTLLSFKRAGDLVMAFILEEDGRLRLASYNNNQNVSSPIIVHRNGDVEVAGSVKTGSSVWGAGFARLFGSSPHIDFHYGSTTDFTTRLIQTASNILRFDIVNSSGTVGYIEMYKSNNSSNPITSLRPMTDNAAYLGDSSHKWNTVYATNTQIQSDKKTKRLIADIAKAEEFIMGLEPKQYKLKNSDTKQGRLHYGFIAQDVAKMAEAIEVGDLSMYQAAVIETDENGDTVELNYDPETQKIKDSSLSWSLNYNEIIAPLVAVVQKQQKQIKELQELLINKED